MYHNILPKFQGLLKIEEHDFPCPNWYFISTSSELPKLPWASNKYGWTIRCCIKGEYNYGLPSSHHLDYSELKNEIDRIGDRTTAEIIYVVYPSWEFDCSGCCFLSVTSATIEIINGDIAPLLRGTKTPDTIYIYEGVYYNRLMSIIGLKNIMTEFEANQIMKLCRRVNAQNTVVLEWTRTKEKKIIFHDWMEII